MKKLFLFIFTIITFNSFSQNINNYEKPPVFPDCESQSIDNLKACFNNKLNHKFFKYIGNFRKKKQKKNRENIDYQKKNNYLINSFRVLDFFPTFFLW